MNKTEINIAACERVKCCLKTVGMSQLELAELIGYTPQHVNRVVKGHAGVSYDMAVKLSRVLHRPAEWFLGLDMGGVGDVLMFKEQLPKNCIIIVKNGETQVIEI